MSSTLFSSPMSATCASCCNGSNGESNHHCRARRSRAMPGRTDRASKIIKASAARIYQAVTTEDELVQWLAPTGMSAEIENFDAKCGGGYRMTLTYNAPPEGGQAKSGANKDVANVRFVRLAPGREIEELVTFDSDDPAFAGAMT